MAIHFGNDKIKDIYFGSDKIKEVYYGSEKVWGEIEYIQDGYWVHKDTGVKTYFGAGGIMSPPSWGPDCSEVQLPSGVTGLGDGCFMSCASLTSITIPESVTSLGLNCFRNCTSIASITLPESVTSIGDYCFYNCTVLSSINIPEGVTSIGNQCFQNCSTLSSINIPEGVTNLGGGCFRGCTSLNSITLPESVTNLGTFCFYDCTSLTLATVLPATPPTLGMSSFDKVHRSFKIKVRSPYVDDYKTATNWINYESIISAIEEEPPITDGYWKHYQTGVITPIYLTDSNITSGTDWRRPPWADLASEIKLPTGITDIMYDSVPMAGLANLPELIILDIPETVSNYNTNFLGNTQKLTKIIIRRTTPVTGGYVSIGPNVGNLAAFDGLYVPEESVNVYKTTSPWSAFSTFIKAIV